MAPDRSGPGRAPAQEATATVAAEVALERATETAVATAKRASESAPAHPRPTEAFRQSRSGASSWRTRVPFEPVTTASLRETRASRAA